MQSEEGSGLDVSANLGLPLPPTRFHTIKRIVIRLCWVFLHRQIDFNHAVANEVDVTQRQVDELRNEAEKSHQAMASETRALRETVTSLTQQLSEAREELMLLKVLTGVDFPDRSGAADRDTGDGPPTAIKPFEVAGIPLVLGDVEGSIAVSAVVNDIGREPYDFASIDLRPGDVVLDLGAHAGVVSSYLAKLCPELRIIAFEPVPQMFALLQENLARNRITNVTAVNTAVTADGRDLEMVGHDSNTGGTTANLTTLNIEGHNNYSVPSTRLTEIFDKYDIDRVKLLKIDIEGSEHEVLQSAGPLLSRIDNLRGEFHENGYLRDKGCTVQGLIEHCRKFIPAEQVQVVTCQMADW